MGNLAVKRLKASGNFVVPYGVTKLRISAKYAIGFSLGGSCYAGAGSMWVDDFGNMHAWGRGSDGRLGNNGIANSNLPIMPMYQYGRIREAKSTTYSSYVLTESGQLYAFGLNGDGRLGTGDITSKSNPTLTAGRRVFSRLFAGVGPVFATGIDGNLYAIGGVNTVGQLGTGDTVTRSSPALVVGGKKFVKVQAGKAQEISFVTQDYVVALDENGDLYAWGHNTVGQLGVGDVVSRSSPTLVIGGKKWLDFGVVPYQSYPLKGGAVIALDVNGDLYSWGLNNSCVLGLGIPSSPLYSVSSPTLVIGGRKWKSFLTNPSSGTVFAIDTNDDCYAWGDNYSGQMGIGLSGATRPEVSSPTLIVGGYKWKTVGAPGEFQAHGITLTGDLYAWGSGLSYLIGDGTNVSKSSPVMIGSAGGWGKIVQDCYEYQGVYTIFAAKENGELYAWGNGTNGAQGVGDTTARSTPTLVAARVFYKRTSERRDLIIDVVPGSTIAFDISKSPATFGTHLLPTGPIEELKVSYFQ